jgi:hypothetical protein
VCLMAPTICPVRRAGPVGFGGLGVSREREASSSSRSCPHERWIWSPPAPHCARDCTTPRHDVHQAGCQGHVTCYPTREMRAAKTPPAQIGRVTRFASHSGRQRIRTLLRLRKNWLD